MKRRIGGTGRVLISSGVIPAILLVLAVQVKMNAVEPSNKNEDKILDMVDVSYRNMECNRHFGRCPFNGRGYMPSFQRMTMRVGNSSRNLRKKYVSTSVLIENINSKE